MIRKSTIANFIFLLAVCYIITPWFFEKKLFFNEFLSASGFLLLAYKRFRIGYDTISIGIILLLTWCGVHLLVSLARQDSLYYYFRNSVIAYSMFAYFTGWFCLKYLGRFISRIRNLLRYYIGIFLLIPLPLGFYERYGVSALFPSLFRNSGHRLLPVLMVIMNIVYGITYGSATALMIAAFLFLVFIAAGYRFFMQSVTVILFFFTAIFIYLQPNLDLVRENFSPYSLNAILRVMESHPILSLDGNATWRMIMWKEILVDHFPSNIFGLGFGTPLLHYYPIEDYSKLASLPYVMGAHNSFVYLFGRLGILFPLLIIPVYIRIFKEYFYHKSWYYSNNQVLLFWSFFSVSIIALFNPALESPLFASGYWMILGFTARSIYNRKQKWRLNASSENTVHS